MAEHNKLNQEFYAYAANLLETKPETIKKYWTACVDTIIHMLHFDGRCQMPGVGTFELKEVPSWTGMAKDDNGDLVERTIPAWFKITYKSNSSNTQYLGFAWINLLYLSEFCLDIIFIKLKYE